MRNRTCKSTNRGAADVIIPIRILGDPVLKTPAKPVEQFDDGARDFDPVTDPDEPDFDDLVITITATEQ